MPSSSPSPSKSVKRTAHTAEIAFQKLRNAIIAGEVKEGSPLREIQVAREWGIGRTPMREAIRRAAECGYLILRPNQAPLVRKLTAEDIVHIYNVREVLECLALENAWPHFSKRDLSHLLELEEIARQEKEPDARRNAQYIFDSELHSFWITRNGNPWLASILERLLIFRPNYQTTSVNLLIAHPDLVELAFAHHQRILTAMTKRDLTAARRALRDHIRHASTVLARLHAPGAEAAA